MRNQRNKTLYWMGKYCKKNGERKNNFKKKRQMAEENKRLLFLILAIQKWSIVVKFRQRRRDTL